MDRSRISDDEVDEFFDAREDISSPCSLSSGSSDLIGDIFDVWIGKPSSVKERRENFRRWMLGLDPIRKHDVVCKETLEVSTEFPMPKDSTECGTSDDNIGTGNLVVNDELECNPSTSSFVASSNDLNRIRRRRRVGWLRKLGAVACIVDRSINENDTDSYSCNSRRNQRVKVRAFGKRVKEFSGVYIGQDIKAHIGAIVTMKFSPDGEYLASGGEDGVVRVWHVVECERNGEVPESDPSCIYFSANHDSTLAPMHFDEESKGKKGSSRRTSDSTCVIVPPEIFRISECPIHSFHGHEGDVLDLSWSKDNYILSSSTDKSVRLWKVGCESCLRVFLHNNYVTCVQFNPIDENQFISGSVDGKIRIWEIPGCRVLDWTDIKQIVTAVCYRPDGKEIIVGSMSGHCLFYDSKDNHLQLEAHLSFPGKKKFPYKRITGFQFSNNDPQKVMITSADSQIWILQGVNILHKYKGLQNSGSQRTASFSTNSRHIISAREDSSIYIWSHNPPKDPPKSRQVKTSWSFERFLSTNALLAIPWNGFRPRTRVPVENFNNFALIQDFLPKNLATWPEEKLPETKSKLTKSQFKFLKTSCENSCHAWGQVIVTAGSDGRIRTFQNYGLPVHS